MHVLLLILKILGITLGSIVGVVLLLILLVLIIPIRYAGAADKHEKINFTARGSWLLHLIHVTFAYEDKETELGVKVFGITVYPKKEKPKKEKKKKKNNKKKSNNKKRDKSVKKPGGEKGEKPEVMAEEALLDEETSIEFEESEVDLEEPKVEIEEPEAETGEPEVEIEEPEAETEEPEDEPAESGTEIDETYEDIFEFGDEEDIDSGQEQKEDAVEKFMNTMDAVADKIDDTIDGVGDRIENIYDSVAEKLENIYNKWVKLKSIIDDERVRRTVSYLLKKVGKLLKHVLPRRIKGTFDYGFEDPAVTGYITALCGALYGRLGDVFTFGPDFEEKKLEGDASFRGRIRLGYIAVIGLAVVLNRDCRYSWKLVKTFNDDSDDVSAKESIKESELSSEFEDDLDI